MALRDLLAKMRDVVKVDEDVSLDLEVSRILMRDQTRPVLFSKLHGMRAAGNLWSTR